MGSRLRAGNGGAAGARSRGLFSGVLQQGYAAGYLLAAAASALVVPHFGWRALFVVGALPALLVLFIRARVPESPAWRERQTGQRASMSAMLGAARQHWKLLLYVVLLMSAFNFMAHSSQDVYPTFLREQIRLPIEIQSATIILYNVGAICGGILFGFYSERLGRRGAIVIAAGLALVLVPLWAGLLSFAIVALAVAAFLMQFMVQGAWGVIPAHLNEISPPQVRSTFTGFAYQLGNLLAAIAPTLVVALAQGHRAATRTPNFSLAQAGVLAAALVGVIVITAVGRENRGRNLRTTEEAVPEDAMNDAWKGYRTIRVPQRGRRLLEEPFFNKGSAFSETERSELGLLGLLPMRVAIMKDQLAHCYEIYLRCQTDLDRYVFLAGLQDHNETLFFRLVLDHIEEMAPIIYTPTVGAACQSYSHLYRRPRGLYIALPQQDDIETILRNAPAADARVIVVTDGERILGLGDLGIGGMGIPVGKLALYTLCAGIHPAATLPIVLDAGTKNPDLLKDPLYLGWQHERLVGPEYDEFVDRFVLGVRKVFPHALLQWEDFGKDNARKLLDRYADQLCTFNDDIQGTGAVTLAALLAATDALGARLSEQRIVMLGAGSAATGICEQVVAAMRTEGCSAEEARAAIWLVDSQGLVHCGRDRLDRAKLMFARPAGEHADEPGAPGVSLEEAVRRVHPTVLIGTAAQPGAFTEAIVREMARHVERPIILPLSNPTSKCEATPADLLAWTDGKALVATGSPFPPVEYGGRTYMIGQCNNAFIFPGMGLGVIAADARRVTPGMFLAATRALSALAPIRIDPTDPCAPLLPPMKDVRTVSHAVALAAGVAAQEDGVAEPCGKDELQRLVEAKMWDPHYPTLKRRWSRP